MKASQTKKKGSIATRLSILVSIMILIGCIAVGLLGYILYRGDCIKLNGEKAQAIADTLASAIDGDDVEYAIATGEKTEAWQRAKLTADNTAIQTGTAYLYVLYADSSTEYTYYVEGYNPASTDPEFDLGELESTEYYSDELLQTAQDGASRYSGLFQSGDYGNMVTGSAAVRNSAGKVVAVVGADLAVDAVLDDANAFGTSTMIIVVIAVVLAGLATVWVMRKFVGAPLTRLEAASEQISVGDLDIEVDDITTNDEIGHLAKSFAAMARRTQRQIDSLKYISDGDLSHDIRMRSEKDTLSAAMIQTSKTLNQVFGTLQASAGHLTTASSQIADGSQQLSNGAAEQSATVDTLAANIAEVAEKAQQNVDTAKQATETVGKVRNQAEQGSVLMDNMLTAVSDIDKANNDIATVIASIDEIASQTNILALNAAVEAARAGEHGKGFAVVAEEVRNLAAKSAEAAKKTEQLVQDSIHKAAQGVEIASEANESFGHIVDGIGESSALISTIAKASAKQSTALETTGENMQHISMVVQQNAASAEESAAAGEELNNQADQLNQIVAGFKLREKKGSGPAIAPGHSAPALPQAKIG